MHPHRIRLISARMVSLDSLVRQNPLLCGASHPAITPGKVVDKVVEKLSSNQQGIVGAIAKNPAVSAKALADLVGISPRKIQDNIAKLKSLGILKRVGTDKGGHWEVMNENKS